jgi:hypothetical protein
MVKNNFLSGAQIRALNETLLIVAYLINLGNRTLILLVLIVFHLAHRRTPKGGCGE